MDAGDQSVCSCLSFGCYFSIPRSAPLNFFVNVKGRNAVFLGVRRLIFYIEPLFAPTLDGVSEFDVKIIDIRADTDNNATYIVGDVF
jgi:hypothetical protein